MITENINKVIPHDKKGLTFFGAGHAEGSSGAHKPEVVPSVQQW